MIGLTAFSMGAWLLVCTPEARNVAAPIAAAVFISALFWLTLADRQGVAPLADVGALTALAMICYTIIPPLQFILSGMEFSILSLFTD